MMKSLEVLDGIDIRKINFKMEKIKKLRLLFKKENIDGYIIPKNDEFHGEYTPEYNDRLKFITNFSGSYGYALVLKNKNFYSLTADILYRQTIKVEFILRFLQSHQLCQKIF